jgi:hypothetical protein
VSRLKHELEELKVEKARECSSLHRMVNELKTQLDENSIEVNKLKRELGMKANEVTTLESRMMKLNEEMEKLNRDHLDKLNQSNLEIQPRVESFAERTRNTIGE